MPQVGRQMEALDRGVVAVRTGDGVFVSWRMLGTDPDSIAFNLYRDGTLVNGMPITDSTNYLDGAGSPTSNYTIRPVVDGKEQEAHAAGAVWTQAYKTIQLMRPGTQYTPNDMSVGDLDGDGDYELIVKWYPNNAQDNAFDGRTDNTMIDAYTMEGERLWRIDLGRNIRSGAHYTQYLVYDFDGDGKAEIAMKTGDGTRDGAGTVIGNANADHRNSGGYILTGPEFLTVFNGETGAAMATTQYLPERGELSSWGDTYGNRMDRFLAGVAYLDGKRPSMIFSRGYYARTVVVAWDWRDGELTRRWTFNADGSQNQNYRGQGAHSLSIADVDADGKDEIVFGAATIDDNGTGLYTTRLGHGDALHVSDMDPDRPGLEVFMAHESPRDYGDHGLEMHDAATGQVLHSQGGGGTDVGRGIAADIDPRYRGYESWGSRGGLRGPGGENLGNAKPSDQMNFAIWWDGDLLRELLTDNRIDKWDYQRGTLRRLLSAGDAGGRSNNGSKATPNLSGDIFGDWREELILRHADGDKLLIFTTTIPTEHRLRTLMHDSQYRVAIAWQNVGYNQPPHPSFFLGADMDEQPVPEIYYPNGQSSPQVTPSASGVRIEEGAAGFCGVDGVTESVNAGFTGTGYANSDNGTGMSVSWAINAPAGGTYDAVVRYASVSNRPASLSVDGDMQASVPFSSTGAWTTWRTASVSLDLQAGVNVVTLTSTGADGLANIDHLQLESADSGVTAASCP